MKPVLLVLNLQVPAHLQQMAQTFPDFDVIYEPEVDRADAAIAEYGARVQCVCTVGATGLMCRVAPQEAPVPLSGLMRYHVLWDQIREVPSASPALTAG